MDSVLLAALIIMYIIFGIILWKAANFIGNRLQLTKIINKAMKCIKGIFFKVRQ